MTALDPKMSDFDLLEAEASPSQWPPEKEKRENKTRASSSHESSSCSFSSILPAEKHGSKPQDTTSLLLLRFLRYNLVDWFEIGRFAFSPFGCEGHKKRIGRDRL